MCVKKATTASSTRWNAARCAGGVRRTKPYVMWVKGCYKKVCAGYPADASSRWICQPVLPKVMTSDATSSTKSRLSKHPPPQKMKAIWKQAAFLLGQAVLISSHRTYFHKKVVVY